MRTRIEAAFFSIADVAPPADWQNLSLTYRIVIFNVVSLYLSFLGKLTVRNTYGDAGMGCQRKLTSSCNEVNRSNLQSEKMLTSDWSKITRASYMRR